VVNPPKTEKELKTKLYANYSACKDALSSSRREFYFFKFCEDVLLWCKILFPQRNKMGESIVDEMGVEISKALNSVIAKDKKPEKNFFGYLYVSLQHAHDEFMRDYLRVNGGMKFPKWVHGIDQFLSAAEGNAERKLTREEKIARLSEMYGISEKKAQVCLDSIDRKNRPVGPTEWVNKNGDGVSLLDRIETTSPYMTTLADESAESILLSKSTAAIVREAVELTISKKQERARECCMALFTKYCFDNSIDFENAASVLNTKIIEKSRKDGETPDQDEIYLMFHPDAKQSSAESMASKILNEFLEKLRETLSEKLKLSEGALGQA